MRLHARSMFCARRWSRLYVVTAQATTRPMSGTAIPTAIERGPGSARATRSAAPTALPPAATSVERDRAGPEPAGVRRLGPGGHQRGAGDHRGGGALVEDGVTRHEELVTDRDRRLGLAVAAGAVVEELVEEPPVVLGAEHVLVELPRHDAGSVEADRHRARAVDHLEGCDRAAVLFDLVPLLVGLGAAVAVALGVGGGDGAGVGPLLLEPVVPPDRRGLRATGGRAGPRSTPDPPPRSARRTRRPRGWSGGRCRRGVVDRRARRRSRRRRRSPSAGRAARAVLVRERGQQAGRRQHGGSDALLARPDDQGGRDVAHVVVPGGAPRPAGGRLGLQHGVDAEVGAAEAA